MISNIPVIGVIAAHINSIKKYMISYAIVKWLQNQGAIIIYISPTFSDETIKEIFNNIDGLVIPGGEDHPEEECLTYQKSKLLIDLALDHGSFPIIGICMGMQYMLTYFSNDKWSNIKNVIKNHKAKHTMKVIKLKNNNLLKNISKETFKEKYFYFNHDHAISLKYFVNNNKLQDFFSVTTLLKYNKINYISTIKSKKYPFFGFQWHPEKPGYEWSSIQNIDRKPEMIMLGNMISKNFVELCIKLKSKKSINQDIVNKYNVENLKTHIFDSNILTDVNYDDPLLCYYLD